MKIFTYQNYLKMIETSGKIAIKIINIEGKNHLGTSGLEENEEKYNIRQNQTGKDIFQKKQINHPHDKIFRSILEDKSQIINIINKVINTSKEITENEIQIYNSSYISERFENKESDIVYKMKEKNIFFLIEHQSKIDYKMPIRILNYEIEIMRQAIGTKKIGKNSKLPVIVPIVIYTGKGKWRAALKIEEYQENLEGYRINTLGEYNLIDINDYSIKDLEKNETFLAKLMIIEKSGSKEELISNLTKIVENEKEAKNIKLLYRIINYVLREKIGNKMTEELLEKLKGGNKNMGLAVMDMLEREERELQKKIRKSCREAKQQGRSIGIIEGKKTGRMEEKIEVVKEMLKNNIKDAIIKKVTHIEEKELEKLKSEIK